MTLLDQVAKAMADRDNEFAQSVEEYATELFEIMTSAESELVKQRMRWLERLPVDEDGRLVGGTQALDIIDQQVADIRQFMTSDMIEPARDWADRAISESFRGGRTLARANVSFGLVDFDVVSLAFRSVTDAEAGVLRVGLRDTYEILNTVGDDIAKFMRNEMTRAASLGLPVQGPGSLAESLFESGRLKPMTIKTAEGKVIQRTIRQRAVGIARIETAKVYNEAHQVKTIEVFGEEPLYKNINPQDHRTTTICDEASRQPPMTLREWQASPWGVPPRLRPDFHLCRSYLLGGNRAIFERYGWMKAAA